MRREEGFLQGSGFLAARRVLALTRTNEWQMLKKWGEGQKDQENLQWYFKGYKDGVNVFLVEFWDRIQREDGWKAPPSQSVSRDKNAYLSRSRIVG